MDTAAGRVQENGTGQGLSVGGQGNARKALADNASACHSFDGREGTEAGANGSRGFAGFLQQTGVKQFLKSQPLQQQRDFCAGARRTSPKERAKTPCQDNAT